MNAKSKIDHNFFHEMVWRRFIRLPYGHVLNYAGKNGEAFFPTAEECNKAMPNPRSWGLPISDGGFFTGLYTYAMIEKYRKDKSQKTADEIEILTRGLYLLQDVAKIEGFIARGVADDGVSHYPMGAECQTFPWVLALFSYYNSDLKCDKESVKARILRVLFALEKCGWNIPCDEEGLFYKCKWENATDWRGVVMFIYCVRVLYELTLDKKYLDKYKSLLETCPKNCVYTRLEIISQGYSHDMITSFGNQTWICTYSHLAVRDLLSLDKENEQTFRTCLYNNGVTALKNAVSINNYDNESGKFDINWRRLNDLWEWYEKSIEKGTEIANRQSAFWCTNVVPHRRMEHGILGNALFATWVATTSGDERISQKALSIMKEGAKNIDWEGMSQSYMFAGECALIFGEDL